MHTITSKQILTPLAEAVFQLILIISEADINKSAIPDLSQLAKVVDAQIVNLVSIGTKIQNQQNADEKLKQEMPKACNEGLDILILVSKASMRLVTGTGVLKDDPMSKHGKTELLESAKGILTGTSNVLYAFDNFEIRKIINCARLCSLKSYIIKMESANFQPQQMVQTLMQTSQIVVQLAQLTTKRIQELLSPVLQQRLKTAVDELTRESPLLITSSKALLQSSSNPYLRESRNQSCDRLMDICMEIEIVVQMIVDDENSSAFGALSTVDNEFKTLIMQLRAIGIKLMANVHSEDEAGTRAALLEYMAGCSELRKRTQEYVEKVNDLKAKKAIEDMLKRQREEEDRIANLSKEIMADPKDFGKQNDLNQSLVVNDKLWNQIGDAKNAYENSFGNILSKSDEEGRKLVYAFNNKDLQAAKQAHSGYFGIVKSLKQRALEYMEKNKDPEVRKTIQQLLTSIDEGEGKIDRLSSELMNDPSNKQKIAELSQQLAANNKSWTAVDVANNQGKEAIFNYLRNLNKEVGEQIVASIQKGDINAAKAAYSKFVPCSEHLHARSLEIKSEMDDPKDQKQIQAVLDEQKQEENEIKGVTSALFNNPTNKPNLETLKETLSDCDTNWGKLASIADADKDKIFTRLQDKSRDDGKKMIKALKVPDTVAAEKFSENYKDGNKQLRERALEYQQKAADPLIQENLKNLISQYDAGQQKIGELTDSLLQEPSSPAKIDQLEKLLDASDKTLSQIAENNQKSGKSIDQLKKDAADAASNFLSAVRSQNLPEAMVYLEAYKQNARNFKQNAQALLELISDPVQIASIQDSINKLGKLEDDLFKFIDDQKILQEPTSDEQKIGKMNDLLSAANTAREKIESDLHKGIVGEVVSAVNELSNHARPETAFGNLYAKAEKGDKANMPGAVSGFKKGGKKLAKILQLLEKMVNDRGEPQLANKLSMSNQRLKKLEPSVVTSLEAVAHSPKDAGALEFGKGMSTIWEENIKDISNNILGQEGVFSAADLINGAKNAYDRQVALLEEAIKQRDIEGALTASKNVAAAGSAFINIAEKEIENTSDEKYKAELIRKVNEVKACMSKFDFSDIPTIESKIGIFANKWNAGQTWPDFESFDLLETIGNLTNGLQELGKLMLRQHGSNDYSIPEVAPYVPPVVEITPTWKEEVDVPVEPAPEASQEPVPEPDPVPLNNQMSTSHEIVFTEEEAPKLLTEAEAIAAPLKAVAQELKVEASKWADDNPIINAVQDISKCFEILSYYHQQLRISPNAENKKGFINAAKDIVLHTNNLVGPAKLIAESCTDLRLKRQLLATLDRLTTLSQQLKIVAAVKASSPTDTDRDAQLIACAQNLMTAIKGCMKECDTISIKQRASAIHITVAPSALKTNSPQKPINPGLVFKRKVYRSPGGVTRH